VWLERGGGKLLGASVPSLRAEKRPLQWGGISDVELCRKSLKEPLQEGGAKKDCRKKVLRKKRLPGQEKEEEGEEPRSRSERGILKGTEREGDSPDHYLRSKNCRRQKFNLNVKVLVGTQEGGSE